MKLYSLWQTAEKLIMLTIYLGTMVAVSSSENFLKALSALAVGFGIMIVFTLLAGLIHD